MVVERHRPVSDQVTSEILMEVTVEVPETEEVPIVAKPIRLCEDTVVRTERAQRLETLKANLRRDEVEMQHPSRKPGSPKLRPAATKGKRKSHDP
ncbi:DUF2382 domain-containing protein [Neoroseomonas rubea]|uniref:DUF2382 domain-containing protein n=1 Tax=Neoroseomonas rubea TaxID=2748666 RepID=UPI0018DF969C